MIRSLFFFIFTKMKIDATPFFWKLIQYIIYLPYEEIEKTDEYIFIKNSMDKQYTYVIKIYHHTLEYENENDLFYKFADFCSTHYPNSEYDILMKQALERIKKFNDTEDEIDGMTDIFLKL